MFYRSGTIKTEMFEELKERLEAAADAAHEEYCDAVKVPPNPTLLYPTLTLTYTSLVVGARGRKETLSTCTVVYLSGTSVALRNGGISSVPCARGMLVATDRRTDVPTNVSTDVPTDVQAMYQLQ